MQGLRIRKAETQDVETIWELLRLGIEKRKNEGSKQWQDGYPNLNVVQNDVDQNYGYVVFESNTKIVGYFALINEIEPAYEEIVGEWLTVGNYSVIHRLIVDLKSPIKGLATWIMQQAEEKTINNGIKSIKVDTNYDNAGMLRVFDKLGYQYCGKVYFRGSERLAYEKIV